MTRPRTRRAVRTAESVVRSLTRGPAAPRTGAEARTAPACPRRGGRVHTAHGRRQRGTPRRRLERAKLGPRCVVHPTNVKDRSTGSPTETLLRLLLPLDNQVTDQVTLFCVLCVLYGYISLYIHVIK